jgi:hypothetical protein
MSLLYHDGSAIRFYSAEVIPSPVLLRAVPPLSALNGAAFSFDFASFFGNAPTGFELHSGTLPAGLSFSGSSITGTPSETASPAPLVVRATNAVGFADTNIFQFSVIEPGDSVGGSGLGIGLFIGLGP